MDSAKLTHRRHNAELTDWVIMFAENNNEHYGPHCWELTTELPKVSDIKELIELAADFYDCDEDEALAMLDPEDIVDGAGAWDDPDFMGCAELGFLVEYRGVIGVRTSDGAIVLDRYAVELKYSHENEE